LAGSWAHSWISASQRFRQPLLSVAVGIVAGLGAIFFDELLYLTLKYCFNWPTGYHEPGANPPVASILGLFSPNPYWLIIIPTLGGLISGLIVFLIAPEAEGHGTDAMIEAFHQRGGYIRRRVPFVKILASALTIGSGGSGGKEGPIAQIGAGFGSFLGSILKLKPREGRVLVLAGAAAGIGAIFRAPLGAALFAPEVLYREMEFESEAILPCVVASIVAYAIFYLFYSRGPLFFPGEVNFALPQELLAYAIFGLVCAGVGYVYIRVFYGLRDYFFHRLPLPRTFGPMIGGLMTGVVIFFYPQVSAIGYGWVQMALEGKMLWHIMLLLALMKILATSCTISSGGSGGVFGPSVFIGAMLGGAFGYFGHALAPDWVVYPNSFVLVGIGGFFGGVAKVPVAAIIMACEMSGNYNLLVPLMVVAFVSYLILGKTSLYEKQVITAIASPAHLGEFARGLLRGMYVHNAVQPRPMTLIPEGMLFNDLVRLVSRSPDSHFPVIDSQEKIIGIISINDIREIMFEEGLSNLIVARDVATPNVVRVFWDDTLQQALDQMAILNVDELPVVRREDPDKIVAMLSKRDIVSYYYQRSAA
jgi:CIC family chloride channel protein